MGMDETAAKVSAAVRWTVGQIAERAGGRVVGDANAWVDRMCGLENSGPGAITFVTSERHIGLLEQQRPTAAICGREIPGSPMTLVIVENVQKALIVALGMFAPRRIVRAGIHPDATVDPTAVLGSRVSVGAGAVIGPGAAVGDDSEIAPGCVIGQDSTVGQRCRLDPNVVVYPRCRIGNDCIIQANTTIGSTGFGYYFFDGAHHLIPHIGGVVIEDFVEIGANCCVDRAKFGDTVIGAGTKIDNLVQIAHNVVIGKCCLMAGQSGMAGSARLEDGAIMAGMSGVTDHVTIGRQAIVGALAGAISDVEPGKQVLGFPAHDQKTFWANYRALMRLPRTIQKIEELKERVARLEAEAKKKTDLS
jgi:UDP-3-O-[3-hydroxymyristoyl] glucosamine N-acyltransferase